MIYDEYIKNGNNCQLNSHKHQQLILKAIKCMYYYFQNIDNESLYIIRNFEIFIIPDFIIKKLGFKQNVW